MVKSCHQTVLPFFLAMFIIVSLVLRNVAIIFN